MAKKQSGNKASSLAGQLLAEAKDAPKYILISRQDLKTLCASVLSQDETKGKRKTVRLTKANEREMVELFKSIRRKPRR